MQALIYTRDNCLYCIKAKELLVANKVPYDEKILDVNGRDDRALTDKQKWATKDELLRAYPAAKTVPQIWVDDQHIGGFVELNSWFANHQ